jgi:hypothetical protein
MTRVKRAFQEMRRRFDRQPNLGPIGGQTRRDGTASGGSRRNRHVPRCRARRSDS